MRKSSMFITDLQNPASVAGFRKCMVLVIIQEEKKKKSIYTVVCSTGYLQPPVSYTDSVIILCIGKVSKIHPPKKPLK